MQGRSQDFSKGGGGGHTVSNIIVMAFSPRNIVGCLLKKKAYKGSVTGTPGPPLATPLERPENFLNDFKMLVFG